MPLTPAQSEGIPGKYTVKAKKSGNLPDSFINQLRLAFDIDQSKPYLIVDCVAKDLMIRVLKQITDMAGKLTGSGGCRVESVDDDAAGRWP